MNVRNARSRRRSTISIFHRHQKPKVLQRGFRLDLGLVSTRCIHNLTKLHVVTIRSNGPCDKSLARRRVFQFMEPHLHFSRSVFPRRDEDIRTRTGQRSREINLDFRVVTFFEVGDAQQRRRVCGRNYARSSS